VFEDRFSDFLRYRSGFTARSDRFGELMMEGDVLVPERVGKAAQHTLTPGERTTET
jgi:hypothetical protein